MKKVDFLGIECIQIANDHISILATISVGPRILSLQTHAGENIFAELPDATLECPGAGLFHFYGGHRLWHAPEDPQVTYLPDDTAVRATAIGNGIRLTQEKESKTSLQKELEIRLLDDLPAVEVRHILTNRGDRECTLAPWAITQLKPGGVAILPQFTDFIDNNPTLPNRSVVLWPYTDINGEDITWGNETILVHAHMKDGRLKIGFPNPVGWMAYWNKGSLFVKRTAFIQGGEYFDRGSSSECYCDPRFLELETLAPVSKLQPGGCIEHIEGWELYENITWTDDLADILSVIRNG